MNCIDCGKKRKSLGKRDQGRCRACWMESCKLYCCDCGVEITKQSSARCRPCAMRQLGLERRQQRVERTRAADEARARHKVGNLGTLAMELERDHATLASRQLAAAIRLTGHAEPVVERPPLSFEEKLALVLAGKARVVPKIVLRQAEPSYTLAGVADWAAL